MFASFFNMFDPAKIFLTSVLDLLHYNKSTYDLDELLKQMNEKNECDILNCTIDISAINNKIPLKHYFINNILIKKTNIIFKKMNFANEKAKLFFEDITIDIYHKKLEEEIKEEIKVEEEEKKSEGSGGFLNNVINVVVHNLVITLKNIKIKIYDKENKNVDYALFINNINFKEAKDAKPIDVKDKGKYLFIHNKAIYIDGILFKEKYEENDNIFFEEKNETIIKNENNILYMRNEIELDIFHDSENSILTIGNLTTKFILENIANTRQICTLYNYFITQEKKEIEKKVLLEKKENKKNDKDGIDLMGFKIKKINFEIKIDLLYLVLFVENKDENIKEKKWISMEENNDKINSKINIIEHFNIYQKNYFIFCINNSLIKNKSFIVDNLSVDLIIPENIDKKQENNIIINDEIQNNIIINYIKITKLSLDSEKNEIKYDDIYLEINDYLFKLLKLTQKNSEKKTQVHDANNNINKEIEENNKENNIISTNVENKINNENKILIEDEKNKLKIIGKNANIKIFLNKDVKNTIESVSLNDIFKQIKNSNYINFEISELNFSNNNIHYDKVELAYNDIELKKAYYIVKLLDKQNSSRIETKENNEINFYFDYELYIFLNPKIIKQILDYSQKISDLINENKDEIKINDNIPKNNNSIINNNLNFGVNINSIKIILTENMENNEKIIISDKNNLVNLPINEIIYKEDNDYISLNFEKISFKLNPKNSTEKINLIIKSFIIEDKLSNSKYKILLSNYEFKKQNEIFMNIELNIFFNNDLKKYEIIPKIKIAPLALYVDQISLYYIYNIINQMKINEEKNNIDNNNIMDIIDKNEEELEINNNEGNYIISNIEIQKFFIELKYTTNDAVKNKEIINSQIASLLNSTSINNLKIIFQDFKTEENIKLNPKDCLKKIYEYYSSDMIKQISGSFVSALPLFNHIYESIDGLLDIVREPYEKYTNNESVVDGFVQGVGSWVVKTATMFTYLGESIGNIFTFKGCSCRGNDDNDNYSTCRHLRYLINENNKEKEEYYLK